MHTLNGNWNLVPFFPNLPEYALRQCLFVRRSCNDHPSLLVRCLLLSRVSEDRSVDCLGSRLERYRMNVLRSSALVAQLYMERRRARRCLDIYVNNRAEEVLCNQLRLAAKYLAGHIKKWWGIQVMETCKPAIRWASRTTLDPTKPLTNDNYSISYAHMNRPALHYRKSGRMYFHNRLVFCIARLLTYVSTHNSAYLVFM